MEHGVSLYSRKVLIQSKAHKVLPNWLRFVKGVVDSEDIPLNLSRELLQDSALIKKLSDVLSARIIKFLLEQQKKDRVKYEKFFKDCGIFFREGIVSAESDEQKQDIAKLLLFESSNEKSGVLTSLPSYVSRMKPTQKNIYYLCAPRYNSLSCEFITMLLFLQLLHNTVLQKHPGLNIERFHSCGHNLPKFIAIKESSLVKKEFNSHSTCLCTDPPGRGVCTQATQYWFGTPA